MSKKGKLLRPCDRIPRELDGRFKLDEEDRKKIKRLWRNGLSQRAIGRAIGINRYTVWRILFPDKARELERKKHTELRKRLGEKRKAKNRIYSRKTTKKRRRLNLRGAYYETL